MSRNRRNAVTCKHEASGGREGYRLRFYDKGGKRRAIWLGNATESYAEQWRAHIEHLAQCSRDEVPFCPASTTWLSRLSRRERAKLEAVELVVPLEPMPQRSLDEPVKPPTLDGLCSRYITARKSVEPGTRDKFEQTQASLVRYFGKTKAIDSITMADAEAWREWLAVAGNDRNKEDKSLSLATVRKRCGIAKQIFAWAVRAKLLQENVFGGLPSTVRANVARQEHVDRARIQKVIDAAPNAEWKALIALARFGGLRIPSEVAGLTWADVDFDEGSLFIRSPKTRRYEGKASRVCPMFVDLRPYLEDLAAAVKPGIDTPLSTPVLPSLISSANLSTKLRKIVAKARLRLWPKAWQNLRASCSTELLIDGFTQKEVSEWLGNSEAVLHEHYAMATRDSFLRAAGLRAAGTEERRGPVRGPVNGSLRQPEAAATESSLSAGASETREKTRKNKGLSVPGSPRRELAMAGKIGPEGLEPPTKGL